MAYIGVSPSNGVRTVFDYTATAGQTSFSGSDNNSQTLTYTDSAYIDVYQNGILLVPSDYTATTGTTVVLDTGATVNDSVQMVVYDVFSVADTVSKSAGGTFDGDITSGGTLNIAGTTTPPSSPSAGDLWFNSATSTVSAVSSKALAVYNGDAWNQMSNLFAATGGTESTYSSGGTNYKVHTFTSSGTFTVSGFSGSVEVLIIAGGGGGGGHSGGGGGAGGLLYYGAETPKTPNGAAISVTPQSYSIVVGAGGAGSGAPYNTVDGRGVSGANSSAFGYTSIGGGGGGSANSSGLAGRDGGSGGGGSRQTAGGSATSGQGNAGGGSGSPSYASAHYPGHGGGGAGAVGGAGTTSAGGAGGVGLQYSISGSATYYAGGGGGTLQDGGGGDKGAGGNGGGGAGRDGAIGEAGDPNTGGGGGGGYYGSGTGGGAGGSGVVIIRYTI
jgi:hypothetical protein